MARLAKLTRSDRIVGNRRYIDTTGRSWPLCQECEHCDGDNGPWVRSDALRGLVCPTCDPVLDEMLSEIEPTTEVA